MKRHKAIVFLIGIIFVAGLALHDLLSEQQQNSGLINSGTTLSPSNFSRRITCEVPIPSVGSKKALGGGSSQEKLQDINHAAKPASINENNEWLQQFNQTNFKNR